MADSGASDRMLVYAGIAMLVLAGWFFPVFTVGMLVGAVLYALNLPKPGEDGEDENRDSGGDLVEK